MSKNDSVKVQEWLETVCRQAVSNNARLIVLPSFRSLAKQLKLERVGHRQLPNVVDEYIGDLLDEHLEHDDPNIGSWARLHDFDTSVEVLVRIYNGDTVYALTSLNGQLESPVTMTFEDFVGYNPNPNDESGYKLEIKELSPEDVEQVKAQLREEYSEAMRIADNAQAAMLSLDQQNKDN